jgi:hypothetical protein
MTTVIKTAGNNKSDLIVHVEFYHNKYFKYKQVFYMQNNR